MKFGVREICDVVLKAKAAQKIGNKIFYAGEPVCYFDTLKTSSMEGAATTVYAQGGRGNARLVALEGERTVTFTMEDALISPEGFMILSGAGLIDATGTKPIYQHMTETVDMRGIKPSGTGMAIHVSELPYMPKENSDNFAYVMLIKNGEIISEPHIPEHYALAKTDDPIDASNSKAFYEKGIATDSKADTVADMTAGKCVSEDKDGGYWIYVAKSLAFNNNDKNESESVESHSKYTSDVPVDFDGTFDSVIVDYYVRRGGSARQIEITPDKFGGNYYLEASTLFRDQNGVDMPAEFIIPNCKIQSNFTFTMASSGDPSSFTFTMDAFPDYTKFDKSKKVLASIQIIEEAGSQSLHRHSTVHEKEHEQLF